MPTLLRVSSLALFLLPSLACGPSRVSDEEANRLLVRQMFAAIDSVDAFRMRRLMSPDIVIHFGTETLGVDEIVEVVQSYYKAFPTNRHEVDQIMVDGDMVAVRAVLHGSHERSYRGFEATGVQVTIPAMHFARIEDGRFVEWWATHDNLAMFEQIGLQLPPRDDP
mgnify:CR=1 FL=1